MKELNTELAIPLFILFRKTLEYEQIPTAWKEGQIIPIFKKGDKSSVSNYRPVSLTSVISKVMETLVRNNIMEHLINEKLALLYLSDGNFSNFSLSWCGNSLSAGIILVARCCTVSNFFISLLRYGDHTRFPYSNSGRTSALYSKARFCLSRYVYDLLIMPKVEFALFTTFFIWSLNPN